MKFSKNWYRDNFWKLYKIKKLLRLNPFYDMINIRIIYITTGGGNN